MKKLFLATVVMACFTQCTKPNTEDLAPQNEGINLRIENATDFNFDNCKVNSSGTQAVEYGAVGKNTKSSYKIHSIAYNYGYISVTKGSENLVMQPVDYMGERPLTNGNYTYKLTFSNSLNRLVLQCVKD